MNLLLEINRLRGNLSKIIFSGDDDSTYNLSENNIFRMKVFNMEQTHYWLNIFFLNIILQYIDKERELSFDLIDKSSTNCHQVYVIAIIVYIVIFLLIFFFYWIPMINTLNVEIYKTKNMLSIIPVQILSSQPNIRELLNISKSNDWKFFSFIILSFIPNLINLIRYYL